jgi:cysteine-rich repeat protein
MMGRFVMASFVILAGCVQSGTTLCSNGEVCAAGTVCAQVVVSGTDTTFCVLPAQVSACASSDDGAGCDAPGGAGTCHDHVCLPDECGNQLVDHFEACDDGNTIAGDGCASDCRSNETCGNSTVDAIAHEDCDLGDTLGHDGCTSGCRAEQMAWAPIGVERPVPRHFSGAAFDVRRGRVVVFGGLDVDDQPLDDTFEWDGTRWIASLPAVSPPRRSQHVMAYDAARDQVVLFSGDTGTADTWIWQGGAWQLKNTATRPPPTYDASMVYDAARERVVLFGLTGTWAWNGTDWKELPQTDPRVAGRENPALGYDATRGVVVMFGGILNNVDQSDLWELDGSDVWTERTFAQPAPAARDSGRIAFDPTSGTVMLVGGYVSFLPRTDAWSWDGTAWKAMAPPPDPNGDLADHMIVTDTLRGVVVVIGISGGLYEWNGTSWSVPPRGASVATPAAPPPRFAQGAAADPTRHQLVVFGGRFVKPDNSTIELADTWIWDGIWRPITTTAVPARYGPAFAYDAKHDQMVMFGGCLVATATGLADTWVFDHEQWTSKTGGTSPPPRCGAAMAYDPALGVVVLLGGMDRATGAPIDDAWIWDGSAWSPLVTPARPDARFSAAMAYDPIRRQLVVSGGQGRVAGAQVAFGDTWVFDGTTWTRASTDGPSARSGAALAWDASREHLVLVGGGAGIVLEDVWEWDGTTWQADSIGGLGRTQQSLVTAFDERGGLLMFGGFSEGFGTADLWHLAYTSDHPYETCGPNDSDGDGLASCADPDCWALCTPLCPPGAACP